MDLAETEVLLFQTCGEDIELSDEPKFLKGVDNRNSRVPLVHRQLAVPHRLPCPLIHLEVKVW